MKSIRFKPAKKNLYLVGLAVVAAGAAWLALKSVSGPAVGDLYRPVDGSYAPLQSYIEQDGKYISFNYPENYRPDPPGKPQAAVLESYTFKKSGGKRPGNLVLAVSVYRLDGKMEEDGSFKIRNQNKDLYSSRLSSINGQAFTIFKKKDGSETTAFTASGSRMGAVSMSGTLAGSNLSETEFTAILNSWQWKK